MTKSSTTLIRKRFQVYRCESGIFIYMPFKVKLRLKLIPTKAKATAFSTFFSSSFYLFFQLILPFFLAHSTFFLAHSTFFSRSFYLFFQIILPFFLAHYNSSLSSNSLINQLKFKLKKKSKIEIQLKLLLNLLA